jgi:hypothetical protein
MNVCTFCKGSGASVPLGGGQWIHFECLLLGLLGRTKKR